MAEWTPDLATSDKPRYLAIADAIAADIGAGRLAVGDRLPPQRKLARRLDVDFTTVARGYVEAQKRGLIESRVGHGTFVRDKPRPRRGQPMPAAALVDLSMNLPPEPDDPELLERMQAGIEMCRAISSRCCATRASAARRPTRTPPRAGSAAARWCPRRRGIFISPGAHPALLGIFGILAKPGDVVLCEALTYPGMRSIAAQLGLKLVGLPMDDEGVDAGCAGRGLQEAQSPRRSISTRPCKTRRPSRSAISGDATSQPSPAGSAADRRGRRLWFYSRPHGHAPFAAIAPDLTWHVAGLAKCIGAGLRIAYVVVPDARSGWPFAAALRAATVMASPLTVALATRWIEDGTADTMLRFIRSETTARQKLVSEILPKGMHKSDPLEFQYLGRTSRPVESRRLSRAHALDRNRRRRQRRIYRERHAAGGGPRLPWRSDRPTQVAAGLEYMAHALTEAPALASAFL